jgi:hypothetical protein
MIDQAVGWFEVFVRDAEVMEDVKRGEETSEERDESVVRNGCAGSGNEDDELYWP